MPYRVRDRSRSGIEAGMVILLWTLGAALPVMAAAGEINVSVSEPTGIARAHWPITSGVPLARGELSDPGNVSLISPSGDSIPVQTEALSRWPDGSIRWLLLDFQADFKPGERANFRLRSGESQRSARTDGPVRVEAGEQVQLETGPLRIRLSGGSFRLLDAVWLDRNNNGRFEDDERMTSAENAGIVLRTPDGRQFRADLSRATMRVEQSGPLRACVRISGSHASSDGQLFRYIVRLHAFAGQPFVKLCYTFLNDHPVDLMSNIDSLDLVFATGTGSETDSKLILDGRPSEAATLFQVDDRSYEVHGKPAGRHATGWAAIGSSRGGLAVGVRDFWQNWPKSLTVGDELRVGICPQFEAGRYDGKPIREESQLYYYLRGGRYSFKVGVSRTHELWATFFDGPPDAQRLSDFYQAAEQPLLAQTSPQYVYKTRAAGRIAPAKKQSGYARYDFWLDQLFKQHLADVKQIREYGMLNYGDWYNPKWDSWGNLEYDTARCFFTQYLRTGDRRYFDRAEQAARHSLDVDVVHAVNDKLHEFPGSAKMRPGHVWLHQVGHTGGYYGRYDGEKYHDEAPLIMKGPYQVGLYNWGHQWIGGVFDYYLLTGDRRALEVATMTADTIAADCPTHYSDHIRDLGWPLNLVIAAYEATGDKKYLDAAGRQWKLMQKHYDPENGFVVLMAYGHCNEASVAKRCRGQNAYMFGLTLSGLARYHRLTQDPEVLEGLTAGVEQMVRTCWSEKHKSFYLTSCTHFGDRPPPALSSATALSSEAFAYESEVTGNVNHRRILREALATMVPAGIESVAKGEQFGQTGYSSMMIHFTPHALWAIDDE